MSSLESPSAEGRSVPLSPTYLNTLKCLHENAVLHEGALNCMSAFANIPSAAIIGADVDKVVELFNQHPRLTVVNLGVKGGDSRFWLQVEVENGPALASFPVNSAIEKMVRFVRANPLHRPLELPNRRDFAKKAIESYITKTAADLVKEGLEPAFVSTVFERSEIRLNFGRSDVQVALFRRFFPNARGSEGELRVNDTPANRKKLEAFRIFAARQRQAAELCESWEPLPLQGVLLEQNALYQAAVDRKKKAFEEEAAKGYQDPEPPREKAAPKPLDRAPQQHELAYLEGTPKQVKFAKAIREAFRNRHPTDRALVTIRTAKWWIDNHKDLAPRLRRTSTTRSF